MNLDRIDLANLVAIGHDREKLALLIDRGDEMEYVEVRAPRGAYDGLQEVAVLANGEIPAIAENVALPMRRTRSSCTKAIGYDASNEVLRVEFANGATYEYEDVDAETWEDFCEADSPGRFYNSEIKGIYRSTRV